MRKNWERQFCSFSVETWRKSAGIFFNSFCWFVCLLAYMGFIIHVLRGKKLWSLTTNSQESAEATKKDHDTAHSLRSESEESDLRGQSSWGTPCWARKITPNCSVSPWQFLSLFIFYFSSQAAKLLGSRRESAQSVNLVNENTFNGFSLVGPKYQIKDLSSWRKEILNKKNPPRGWAPRGSECQTCWIWGELLLQGSFASSRVFWLS